MTIRVIPSRITGTARVLKVTRTSQVARCPEAGWHAPWVHRFVLLVTLPGRPLFVATSRAYAPDVLPGATVRVLASPLWHRRVTLDLPLSPAGSPSDLPSPAEGVLQPAVWSPSRLRPAR